MDKRFFNKETKQENLFGVHFEAEYDEEADEVSGLPSHFIELPADHVFWQAAAADKYIDFDADGLPELVDNPAIVVSINDLFDRKSAAINARYTDAMDLILKDYPPAERDTFPEQALEALAYKMAEDAAEDIDDNDYPMLKNISVRKNISISNHKDTVLFKRGIFNNMCGTLTGKKYGLMMQLEAIDITASNADDLIAAVDENSIITVAEGLIA